MSNVSLNSLFAVRFKRVERLFFFAIIAPRYRSFAVTVTQLRYLITVQNYVIIHNVFLSFGKNLNQ